MERVNGRTLIDGKSIAKAPLSKLINLEASDINRLTKKDLLSLEKRYAKAATQRIERIKKNTGMPSYAADRYLGTQTPKVSSPRSTIQQLRHKVVKYQSFFEGKTSTVKGTKKVLAEEEKRIFDDRKGFLNDKQRTRFWSAYMEFMNQNPIYIDQSERVQEFLGRSTFWRRRSFNQADLNTILSKLENSEGVDIRADAGSQS